VGRVLSTWGRFAAWALALALASAALGALVAAVSGALAGAAAGLALAAAGLLVALALHYRQVARLRRWLIEPRADTLPEAGGVWEEIYAGLHRLLRRQRQSESRLSATLSEFERAGAAMPDGLVVLDARDRIEWCNPRAGEHLGLDLARDRGQQITYLLRQPRFAEYLRAHSLGEPLVLRPAHAKGRVLALQLVPYGEQQKLLISRDVTELERVEAMRRDFVANVSHELRTPLTVLAGFLETLAETGGSDRALLERSLPLMLEQARRMQRLVEDLLTLSRLESSAEPPRRDPVDVPALVRALYDEALALSAGRHRIGLEVRSEAGVLGSEEELRAAFGNLVSNAVRYTPAGGEVTIRWDEHGEGAAFTVRDTGIGIAAEHIPRLTERFYRVDRSRSRETGGTGLGLAIVKHVLQRHDARLEIESEPGRGSTFRALFPRARLLGPEAFRERAGALAAGG
jgi:two-component system phosphate regulon sensor histidine kinase PhoR